MMYIISSNILIYCSTITYYAKNHSALELYYAPSKIPYLSPSHLVAKKQRLLFELEGKNGRSEKAGMVKWLQM